MRISFDVESFAKRPKDLITVLCYLKATGQFSLMHYSEVEDIVCKTPSNALKYCQYVVGSFGLSAKAERVFLKNPVIGVRYLKVVRRDCLQDGKTQARLWSKIVGDPNLALDWASSFRKRLSAEEEMVFVSNVACAKHYALHVIGGPFPEEVHNKLILKSFGGMAEWESKHLKEYLRWAEPQMKNLEGTRG